MAEAVTKPNPIVKFEYNESANAYKTTLADGNAGPDISLQDMFVLKDLKKRDLEITNVLASATTLRNNINTSTSKMNEMKNDINTNYPKVQQEVNNLSKIIG